MMKHDEVQIGKDGWPQVSHKFMWTRGVSCFLGRGAANGTGTCTKGTRRRSAESVFPLGSSAVYRVLSFGGQVVFATIPCDSRRLPPSMWQTSAKSVLVECEPSIGHFASSGWLLPTANRTHDLHLFWCSRRYVHSPKAICQARSRSPARRQRSPVRCKLCHVFLLFRSHFWLFVLQMVGSF